MAELINLSGTIPLSMSGERLDKVLAELFPDYSRSQLSKWIKNHSITIDGHTAYPKQRVHGSERILINAECLAQDDCKPQNIDLELSYEDTHCLIINKAAGLVVHPGAGNPDKTLVNALLYHYPDLIHLPRAGIIHRLDKDTTGLLLVAKTLKAYTALSQMMQNRTIKRQYQAITHGIITGHNTIDAPIGRHPRNRLKMAVVTQGKPAITHYRVAKNYAAHTLLDVALETGRTHQIRVHLAWKKHPLLGDPLYGVKSKVPREATQQLIDCLDQFNRQALHAYRLSFIHPITQKTLEVCAPLPQDLINLCDLLEQA